MEHICQTDVKVDDAIPIVKSLGVEASVSKCDVNDAFTNIPLNPETWHLFGLKWEYKYIFTLVYVLDVDHYQRFPISCLLQFVGFCGIIII